MAFSSRFSLPEVSVDKEILEAVEHWEVDNPEDEEDAQRLIEANPEVVKPKVKPRKAQQYTGAEQVPTQQDLLTGEITMQRGTAGAEASSSPVDAKDISLRLQEQLTLMMADFLGCQKQWVNAHTASELQARRYHEMKLQILKTEIAEKQQARDSISNIDRRNLPILPRGR